MHFISQLAQYYDTYNYTSDNLTPTQATAVALSTALLVTVIVLISYVVGAWLLGRIFKKAGVPQWIAWVPFYNVWKTLELGGQQGFWAVLAIIPVVNIVAAIFLYIAMYKIGLKFGKSGAFVLWAIFLPLVWYAWLAFDDSKWQGDLIETPTPSQPTAAL